MKLIVPLFALIAACTPAQSAADIAKVQAADDVIMSALPFACGIADTIDPSGATIVCAVLDAGGNIVASVTKQLESAAVAKAVVAAHPATAPQTVALKAAAVMPLAKP